MYERFTDRARKVMQMANQEAQRFHHEYIGTEHILLGICKEQSGLAYEALKLMNIDLRKVRLEIEKLVQSGPEMVTMGRLPQTPRAKKVIEYSMEAARDLNDNYVGTQHILMGLWRENEGVAYNILNQLGFSEEKFVEAINSEEMAENVPEQLKQMLERVNVHVEIRDKRATAQDHEDDYVMKRITSVVLSHLIDLDSDPKNSLAEIRQIMGS